MTSNGKELTAKQRRFVDEYLVDLNATAAATRAGYSEKNADKIGPELLGKTRVSEAIAKRMKKRADKIEITQDSVLAMLDETIGEARRAKQCAAAIRGIELLGKHIGMFRERIEHIGNPLDVGLLSTAECRALLMELAAKGMEMPPEATAALAEYREGGGNG